MVLMTTCWQTCKIAASGRGTNEVYAAENEAFYDGVGTAGRIRFTWSVGFATGVVLGGKETQAAVVEPGAARSLETYVWVRRHGVLEAVNVCHQYDELCSSSRDPALNSLIRHLLVLNILNLILASLLIIPSTLHHQPNHSSNHTTACTNALSFANGPSFLSRSPRTANPCATPPYKHTCHGCPTSARIPSVSYRFSAGNI